MKIIDDDAARSRSGTDLPATTFEVFCLITDYFKENRAPVSSARFARDVGWQELLARNRLNRLAERYALNRRAVSKRPLRYVYWFKPLPLLGGEPDVL